MSDDAREYYFVQKFDSRIQFEGAFNDPHLESGSYKLALFCRSCGEGELVGACPGCGKNAMNGTTNASPYRLVGSSGRAALSCMNCGQKIMGRRCSCGAQLAIDHLTLAERNIVPQKGEIAQLVGCFAVAVIGGGGLLYLMLS